MLIFSFPFFEKMLPRKPCFMAYSLFYFIIWIVVYFLQEQFTVRQCFCWQILHYLLKSLLICYLLLFQGLNYSFHFVFSSQNSLQAGFQTLNFSMSNL